MALRLLNLTRHLVGLSGSSSGANIGLMSQESSSVRNMSSLKVVLSEDKVSARVEWPGWGFNNLLFWGKPLPQLRPLHLLQMLEYIRETAYDCGYLDYRKLDETHLSYFKCIDFEVDPTFKKRLPHDCKPFEYPLVAELSLRHVGRTSLVLHHVIKNSINEQVYFRSTVLSVEVLKSTRKPAPLPEWWRNKFIPTSPGQSFGFKPFNMDIPPTFVHKLVVQPTSCDYYGHLNNTAYIPLCVDAVLTGSKHGLMGNATQEQLETSVIYADQQFLKDCNAGDQVNISVWRQKTQDHSTKFKCAISGEDGETIYQQTMVVC